jgi:hypothetical protein
MAKILLIEPYKILQQAIALSLFPEHEVQVEETLSASGIGSVRDIDLLIVDAGALRELGQLNSEASRALESCPAPILWLEEDDASRPPKREKLALVKKPIEKQALESALAELLSPPESSRRRSVARAAPEPKAEKAKDDRKKSSARAPGQTAFQFIDLVDVVEEEPPATRGRKSPKKSK